MCMHYCYRVLNEEKEIWNYVFGNTLNITEIQDQVQFSEMPIFILESLYCKQNKSPPTMFRDPNKNEQKVRFLLNVPQQKKEKYK